MSETNTLHRTVRAIVKQLQPSVSDASLPPPLLRRWVTHLEGLPLAMRQEIGRDLVIVALRFGKARARLATAAMIFLATVAVGPKRAGDLLERAGQSRDQARELVAQARTAHRDPTAGLLGAGRVGFSLTKAPQRFVAPTKRSSSRHRLGGLDRG